MKDCAKHRIYWPQLYYSFAGSLSYRPNFYESCRGKVNQQNKKKREKYMLHNLKKQKLIILTFLHSPGKCRIRRTFYNWALSEGVPWSSSYWLNDRLEWMLHMLSTAERRNRWREREKGRGGREKAIILIYVYGKYEIYLYITNIRRSNNNNKDGENVLIFQMFIWWFLSFRHCPLPTPIPPPIKLAWNTTTWSDRFIDPFLHTFDQRKIG